MVHLINSSFLCFEVITGHSSSGSRAEANILKHVRREWPELIRDGLALSPDNTSGGSSPTLYNSPLGESIEFQSALLTNGGSSHTPPTASTKDTSLVSDGAMSSASKSTTPGKRGVTVSTKRLKESLLALRKSSVKATDEALEPTA
jgi:hypothetical protein